MIISITGTFLVDILSNKQYGIHAVSTLKLEASFKQVPAVSNQDQSVTFIYCYSIAFKYPEYYKYKNVLQSLVA